MSCSRQARKQCGRFPQADGKYMDGSNTLVTMGTGNSPHFSSSTANYGDSPLFEAVWSAYAP